jgi:hypothetical protein
MVRLELIIKPAKIASPPNVGTTFSWDFLSSGTSYKCFKYDTRITDGIAIITITRLDIKARRISNIAFLLLQI